MFLFNKNRVAMVALVCIMTVHASQSPRHMTVQSNQNVGQRVQMSVVSDPMFDIIHSYAQHNPWGSLLPHVKQSKKKKNKNTHFYEVLLKDKNQRVENCDTNFNDYITYQQMLSLSSPSLPITTPEQPVLDNRDRAETDSFLPVSLVMPVAFTQEPEKKEQEAVILAEQQDHIVLPVTTVPELDVYVATAICKPELLLRQAIQCVDYPMLYNILITMPELINYQDEDGNTPLHWAAERSFFHKNSGMITLLLAWGADVKLANNEGDQPLDIIINQCFNNKVPKAGKMGQGRKTVNKSWDVTKEIVQIFIEHAPVANDYKTIHSAHNICLRLQGGNKKAMQIMVLNPLIKSFQNRFGKNSLQDFSKQEDQQQELFVNQGIKRTRADQAGELRASNKRSKADHSH